VLPPPPPMTPAANPPSIGAEPLCYIELLVAVIHIHCQQVSSQEVDLIDIRVVNQEIDHIGTTWAGLVMVDTCSCLAWVQAPVSPAPFFAGRTSMHPLPC
jgi:hypothetical protein